MSEREVQIAQTEINIPGLKPDKVYPPIFNNKSGKIMREGYTQEANLSEKSQEIRDEIKKRPWLRNLWRDIRAGKKSAIVTVVLGGLVITTAAGAEFEFGIRHGRDIKEIRNLLKRKE